MTRLLLEKRIFSKVSNPNWKAYLTKKQAGQQ
jgi:hypothetical protein